MAKLTAAERRKLPAKDFALGKGHYPIDTKKRARNALARISEYGSPSQERRVEEKVRRKYPGIKVRGASTPAEKLRAGRKAHGPSYRKRERRKR